VHEVGLYPRCVAGAQGERLVEILQRPGVPTVLDEEAIRAAALRALDAAAAPSPATMTVILSDDRELATLNGQAMGRPEATDVLSFPLLPPSAFPAHPGGPDRDAAAPPGTSFVLPPGEPLHLGEIVVSVQRAVEQAAGGHGGQTGDLTSSPQEELRLLVTHGVLHLCGWDHADPAEETAMRELERSLLTAAT
jgi:probable rRNA maturation factor